MPILVLRPETKITRSRHGRILRPFESCLVKVLSPKQVFWNRRVFRNISVLIAKNAVLAFASFAIQYMSVFKTWNIANSIFAQKGASYGYVGQEIPANLGSFSNLAAAELKSVRGMRVSA